MWPWLPGQHCLQAGSRWDAPLRCDWERRPRQMVDAVAGKPSSTRYCAAPGQDGVPPGCTRLWLEPITGRSHQLRVHMIYLGQVLKR